MAPSAPSPNRKAQLMIEKVLDALLYPVAWVYWKLSHKK